VGNNAGERDDADEALSLASVVGDDEIVEGDEDFPIGEAIEEDGCNDKDFSLTEDLEGEGFNDGF
jgi:hypothetical protein